MSLRDTLTREPVVLFFNIFEGFKHFDVSLHWKMIRGCHPIPSDAVLSKTFWISCLVVAVMMVGSYRRSEFESRRGQKLFFQANPNYKGSKKWKKMFGPEENIFQMKFLVFSFPKSFDPTKKNFAETCKISFKHFLTQKASTCLYQNHGLRFV